MNGQLDLNSLRAQKARLAKALGPLGYRGLLVAALVLIAAAIAFWLTGHQRLDYFAFALGLACWLPAIWYKQDLESLPPTSGGLTGQLSGDVLARLKPGAELTPQSLWLALASHYQTLFITNRLLLPASAIANDLSSNSADLASVWDAAKSLAPEGSAPAIEPGHIAAALLLTSPSINQIISQMKMSDGDIRAVAAWLNRALQNMRAPRPYFGGLGRDWANGFTPLLERFGYNMSLEIEKGGQHYDALTGSPGVLAIKNAFGQGASAIALIGDPGSGKTSHASALAQVLLAEKNDRNLEHRQIIALSPSSIISSAQGQGAIERIVMGLMRETAHAGHIILFFDDAQAFFSSGVGAFDITQILLPVLQGGAIQLVMAMTPHDWQQLRSNNSAFANLLTPVILTERPEGEVMRVLEDTALTLEYRHKALITYPALQEAYRLSGRYEQDMAYPGKAIQLLTQSLPHANQAIVTPESVQAAIEQTRGVKVGASTAVEADTLLHLEDKIHERMINQARAVQVVAAALRRARAGVANPKRPIGSFLFLGPTGVGKTELSKAIAATYFGNEANMTRLDMSEYQQPDDVQRLLSSGAEEASSLIMAVRSAPFSVVLLDEIEKAHPNILNLLLQMLDEGQLTDASGRAASFKDCIIIATSNAGASEIREHIEKGEELESFEAQFTDSLINSGQFKPELLNRFDEIVLFRPLKPEELAQIVMLMMSDINKTLANQKITVELTQTAVAKIVAAGYDARLGARPMRRALNRAVEDNIANKILAGAVQPGQNVLLDAPDLTL